MARRAQGPARSFALRSQDYPRAGAPAIMRLLTALACVALMSCIATAQTDMDTCLLSKEQAAKAKWSPLKEKCGEHAHANCVLALPDVTPGGLLLQLQEKRHSQTNCLLPAAADPSITLEERCTSCLCGFREVLAPLMAESGVSVNVSDVDQSQATSAVMACYDIVSPA